ncbi:hypothetical protein [Halarchaeum nitratireducens]|uniref:Zona occludens toxin N-terminal domain-containing protein n=1 Tax=Halarchaeum nitratireducens TaxID=489913 RepID=A0A830GCV3_9EURY|nr:hypothetical protein [Halarchaeum nitratireducens]GGN17864.1 hypothetical protein GCM10009021_18440 [Halarchaeum nitratireducens]
MSEDGEQYTPPQLREHQAEHGHRDPLVHQHTGITRDPALSRFLSIQANSYDPVSYAETPGKMPGDPAETDLVQTILQNEATDVGREALEEGDMATLKHLTGDAGQQADVSGLKAIGKIDRLLDNPAPVLTLLGKMGKGKTDFAFMLAQRLTALADERVLVGTNVRTLREADTFIPDFPTLKEWLEQDGDPTTNAQRRKVFIGDEFSISASGRGKAGYETAQKMGPMLFLIRKYNGALIYIAHTPHSIHPMLRRMSTIIRKTDRKVAEIDVQGGETTNPSYTIEGVPPTDWRYNDKEASTWSWDADPEAVADGGKSVAVEDIASTESEARKISIATAIDGMQLGMSSREIAEYIDYSYKWVQNRQKEYRDDGEHREVVIEVDSVLSA